MSKHTTVNGHYINNNSLKPKSVSTSLSNIYKVSKHKKIVDSTVQTQHNKINVQTCRTNQHLQSVNHPKQKKIVYSNNIYNQFQHKTKQKTQTTHWLKCLPFDDCATILFRCAIYDLFLFGVTTLRVSSTTTTSLDSDKTCVVYGYTRSSNKSSRSITVCWDTRTEWTLGVLLTVTFILRPGICWLVISSGGARTGT